MTEYDMIVIGSGSAMSVLEHAVAHNMKVALIDKGPSGGTCLNVGCIPSKMLVAAADKVMQIKEADKFGIFADIKNIDFEQIMAYMHDYVDPVHKNIEKSLTDTEMFDYYSGTAHFVDDYTLKVNGKTIKSKKIVIGAGSRPLIPPIKGIDKVNYLTNESLLQLKTLPESMVIVGGGYIAAEYGHFFSALGTQVTILEKGDRLVSWEEPEISELLSKKLSERMKVVTGTQATEIRQHNNNKIVHTNKTNMQFTAESVLIASGRESNADLLKPENSGIKLDDKGFIKTNEYFETSKNNIWAIGDINGKSMFTHTANEEAATLLHNIFHGEKIPFSYEAIPHAIYSYPQIASVGLTESQAAKNYNIFVGKAKYSDVAKGSALREHEGFAKAIVDKGSHQILGFHIIGPNAPVLIQEVVNAMTSEHGINDIMGSVHIHPSLSELVQVTFAHLE